MAKNVFDAASKGYEGIKKLWGYRVPIALAGIGYVGINKLMDSKKENKKDKAIDQLQEYLSLQINRQNEEGDSKMPKRVVKPITYPEY